MRVAGFSAHSGTTAEVVVADTDFVNGHTYIMIKGANGASSATEPYTLQVETSVPNDTPANINDGISPSPTPVVANGGSTPVTECSPPADAGPLTLFVTQADRIDALYADTASTTPSCRAWHERVDANSARPRRGDLGAGQHLRRLGQRSVGHDPGQRRRQAHPR